MTCTGCMHSDYCIYYGCPFKREPQAQFAATNYGCPMCGRTDWNCGRPDCINGPRETHIRERKHQVTDDAHHVRSAFVNSKLISKFGCVDTGPNPHRIEGSKAIDTSGPSSRFWIARGGVTATLNSQVLA